MSKPLSLTLVFIVLIGILFQFDQDNIRSQSEEKTSGDKKENREEGPSEFLKFHQAIRTRSDQNKPGYPKNYQWAELQKASAYSKKNTSAARTQSNANGVISYTERGPGNVPGRTRGLLVDPDDATHKTWFAGSASGGIWKTTDGGNSWQWLTPAFPNLGTTTLAMAASNHNTIFAGTGEGFGTVDGVNGSGIFKSINKGGNWTLLNATAAFGPVNRIIVNPNDETNVIAATNYGIYRSTDGGTTWTLAFKGTVQDINPAPDNFSIIYAAQYGVGVIKSTDGGATWATSNAGMATPGRTEIDISPVQTNRIIASAEGDTTSNLYVSDNGGSTWYLVTLSLANKTVKYLGSQGWYDNAVAFSPYNKDVVYVGGTGVYQVTLGAPLTGSTGNYTMIEKNTSSFLSLINFGGTYYGGKLTTGSGINQDSIEVRFGPGLSQKANRFLVPVGATSGVPDANYSYQDYVDVPFQVWDVTKNQQLMVSFRDQNRNGVFDLITTNTTATDATQQSREYIFIHNVAYNPTTPSSSLAVNGGQAINQMYFFWPVLADGATWTPSNLPPSKLQLFYQQINRYSSTVVSVADVYAEYDGKNNSNFVHPDQHNICPIKQNDANQTYQLLLANDGGLFLSGISTSPGTTQGEWKSVGLGYNTSQFYGADKKPGAQQYLGGMQDNATYFSPSGITASSSTVYNTNTQLAGDGFEVLWHSQDPNKMIGGSQYNNFARSLDGGSTWSSAVTGFTLSGGSTDQTKYPFISKLSTSKQAPDIIYTVGAAGVWKSTNFGGNWSLTPITSNWGASSWADIEVSRANANIVWAGSGIGSGGSVFVSTDAGKTFTKASDAPGYTLGNLTRLESDPINEKVAYVIFSFAKTAKILKTTDLGQTWSDITGFGTSGTTSNNGFPDVAVYCLYVRPDNPNIIWAGTEIGIVESLDGGTSWAMLSEFPNISVWDMKGQDKEIVIATHGRGIWTAELNIDQNANFPNPKILAAGTSPQSKFAMKIVVPAGYDSTHVLINSTLAGTLPASVKDTVIIQIGNVNPGTVTSQLVCYKGNSPVFSLLKTTAHLKLQAYQNHFFDYFVDNSNFASSGLSVNTFGSSNLSLQSAHNYLPNSESVATLLAPIIVAATNANFIYQDVAIVQPGATGSVFGQSNFNDYVVVEGTKDGLTWTPLANGYNASANQNWLSAFNSSSVGTNAMFASENLNLRDKFAASDTILVRFRLYANSDATTGWGWAIDNLYIQQTPTEIEKQQIGFSVYPNPSSGNFKVKYELTEATDVKITIWDMTGKNILDRNLGMQSIGSYEEEFELSALKEGPYILRLSGANFSATSKLLIRQ